MSVGLQRSLPEKITDRLVAAENYALAGDHSAHSRDQTFPEAEDSLLLNHRSGAVNEAFVAVGVEALEAGFYGVEAGREGGRGGEGIRREGSVEG